MESLLAAWAQELRQATSSEFAAFVALAGGIGILLLALSFRQLRRARLIEDTPTSRIRSAAQGYLELHGLARLLPGPPIVSPLSGERCCWWSYSVEERVRDDGGRHRRWRTIERATSDDLFLLVDSTGECIVDPVGATVVPGMTRSWYGHRRHPGAAPKHSRHSLWWGSGNYRYRERLIRFGDSLYAIGAFRTQGVEHSFHEEQDVRDLLVEWKRNRRELHARFDANRDGMIDAREWDQARRHAIESVREQQVERAAAPDLHVLSRPADGRPFLLSTVPQDRLVLRARGAALALLVAALSLLSLLWFGFQVRP